MPRTFALFAVGAVAICGLPPLNGFASELLLYLGLLRAAAPGGPPGLASAGLAAPVLAMIGALAVACFVKVAGIAFGGAAARARRPRAPTTPARACWRRWPRSPSAAPLLGLFPSVAVPLLEGAIAAWDPAAVAAGAPLASLAPFGWVSAGGVLLLASVGLVAAAVGRCAASAADAVTWDCGYARPTPRMQYTGSSFSETLVGLFDWAVRSRRAPPALRGPFPGAARFESEVPDAVLDGLVLPLAGAADRGLARMRVFQRGPVQMYLLYVLLAVVTLLVVTR